MTEEEKAEQQKRRHEFRKRRIIVAGPSAEVFEVRVRLRGLNGEWPMFRCGWCDNLIMAPDRASLPPHECIAPDDIDGVE